MEGPRWGNNQFVMAASYDCPAIVHTPNGSGGTTYSWDYGNLHHTDMWGDGILVSGNIPTPSVFSTVGGTISGLTGTVVLQNNGGDNQTVTAPSNSFTFTPIAANAPYDVTVLTQPTDQTCTVQNGSGTASSNVPNVAVNCVTTYPIGGNVSGLVGTGLVLQNNSAVSAFAIGANGVLAAVGSPLATLFSLPYAITAHPTLDFVYVAHGSSNFEVTVYSVNPADGTLTLQQTLTNVISSANGIVIDPNGRFAYVDDGGGICAFAINVSNGQLTSKGCIGTNGGTFALAVHPNDQYIYVVNDTTSNNVVVFAINPSTGALTLVGSPVSAGNNPRGVTVNAAGTFLYVTNYSSNDVSALSISGGGAHPQSAWCDDGAPQQYPAGHRRHTLMRMLEKGLAGHAAFAGAFF